MNCSPRTLPYGPPVDQQAALLQWDLEWGPVQIALTKEA
jgi:hypothetical protein